jgi:asparagine synthase (glutamine-hydrolysing)
MCGIAGWVDFEERTPAGVLEAMTATMACRGPDEGGLWSAGPAALGHRRLSVIDIEGGRQPMRAGPAVLTYSGEIYNHHELRAELARRGHGFGTGSDTEVVLRAYLEWGADCTERLNGMFAFALWDAATRCLTLVRDRLGIKPLYYVPTDHGVIFGSEPKALFAHPDIRPIVTADGLRQIFTTVKQPGETAYEGIREVCPGEIVRVTRAGIHRRTYWSLQTVEHTDDLDTSIHTVRDLLDDIVRRQLEADVPIGTLLSGGLDSSAITAIAASATGSVRSFAVDFAGYAESFVPAEGRVTPDAPYVAALAGHVGSDHTDVVLSSTELSDPALRSNVLSAMDLPIGGTDGYGSLYLLFRAIRGHSTVALSGEAADEVFGGYQAFHNPEVVRAATFPWLVRAGRQPGRAALLRPDLRSRLDLREYIVDSYRTALGRVDPLPGESQLETRMREISYLYLRYFLPILLDRKDRLSMANGIEVRVPFCDDRLVEYLYNVPWSMKTHDGREKSLLRSATGHLLPAIIRDRVKSPYPVTQDPAYHKAIHSEFTDMLADPNAPVHQLIDAHSVPRITGSRLLGFLLQLNAWMREYEPELRI